LAQTITLFKVLSEGYVRTLSIMRTDFRPFKNY